MHVFYMVRMMSAEPKSPEKLFALPWDSEVKEDAIKAPNELPEHLQKVLEKWDKKPVGTGKRLDPDKELRKLIK